MKLVKQGNHTKRIGAYYKIMRDATRKEFTEDNEFTLDMFLGDLHKESK